MKNSQMPDDKDPTKKINTCTMPFLYNYVKYVPDPLGTYITTDGNNFFEFNPATNQLKHNDAWVDVPSTIDITKRFKKFDNIGPFKIEFPEISTDRYGLKETDKTFNDNGRIVNYKEYNSHVIFDNEKHARFFEGMEAVKFAIAKLIYDNRKSFPNLVIDPANPTRMAPLLRAKIDEDGKIIEGFPREQYYKMKGSTNLVKITILKDEAGNVIIDEKTTKPKYDKHVIPSKEFKMLKNYSIAMIPVVTFVGTFYTGGMSDPVRIQSFISSAIITSLKDGGSSDQTDAINYMVNERSDELLELDKKILQLQLSLAANEKNNAEAAIVNSPITSQLINQGQGQMQGQNQMQQFPQQGQTQQMQQMQPMPNSQFQGQGQASQMQGQNQMQQFPPQNQQFQGQNPAMQQFSQQNQQFQGQTMPSQQFSQQPSQQGGYPMQSVTPSMIPGMASMSGASVTTQSAPSMTSQQINYGVTPEMMNMMNNGTGQSQGGQSLLTL